MDTLVRSPGEEMPLPRHNAQADILEPGWTYQRHWTALFSHGKVALNFGEARLRKSILNIVLLLLAAIGIAGAEEIQLKDGTKITGTITGVTADKFQVKTAYGDIQIPRTDIVTISFPGNAPKDATPEVPAIDQSLEGHKYTNRTEGFQITVPDNWVMAPEMLSHDIHGALKSRDETLFFFYTPEKFDGTINTYLVVAESALQGKFKDFEKLSQTEVTLDGQKVTRVVWHGKNATAHDTPIKALVYVIPYEGKMVRLSFLTLEQLFNDALPSFEKMAATFHAGVMK